MAAPLLVQESYREVSVVIPTHRREKRLANLLASLRATSPKSLDRVVVLDDSTDTGTIPLAADGLRVEVIGSTERRFISRAKNIGWRSVDSPLVAFIDDDNCVTNGLLDRLAGHFRARPQLGAVMPGALYKQRPDIVWVYATPYRPDRWGFHLVGRNLPRNPSLEDRWLPTDALPNFSMIRRTALEQVGGFDENFPINSSADLCQRLKEAGWEVGSDAGALTLHDVEPPGKPAYWAEHVTQDPERLRYEVADWFYFQRRWNGGRQLFRLQASWHALGFLFPTSIGIWTRPASARVRLSLEMFHGYLDGLRRTMGPRAGIAPR
jgi:GT2 family glycosyltransferase